MGRVIISKETVKLHGKGIKPPCFDVVGGLLVTSIFVYQAYYVGNSHDIVYVVCERSILCCIVYFALEMYFFWHLNNLLVRKQHYFWETYENIYTFFSFPQFDSTKPIHTYIISHYNPSVSITTYVLTPLMLCVLILYISGGTYSLKSTPNAKFFKKLFMAILFTLRVFARNLLRENRRRNSFRISFLMSGLGLEPWLFV